MPEIDPTFQMWATFAVIVVALAFFALERYPMVVTSLGVICALLALFHFFPVLGPSSENLLDAPHLLHGFASPALITILALLVVGQGLQSAGAMDFGARLLIRLGGPEAWLSIAVMLASVLAVSGFLNNIPVVVIFVPIMQAVAARLRRSPSTVMMPLSFAAILGGMTTLIGSSTNLLVSDQLVEIGRDPLDFFAFTVPGLVVACVGFLYVVLVAPRILPDRASMAGALIHEPGKQFIAEITVPGQSKLVKQKAVGGFFPGFKDLTVRMILRGEHAHLPPFEDLSIQPGDLIIVAATRKALTDVIARGSGVLIPALRDIYGLPELAISDMPRDLGVDTGNQILAEVMVAPNSGMAGRTLEQIRFRYQHRCIVLGMERRSRMIRARLTEIPLEAGDVLLIQGRPEDVEQLRNNRDVILMEWSASDLPSPRRARYAGLIFLSVVVAAASGVIPIVVSAVVGALAMVATGILNVRQVVRAVDPTIIMTIATALALGAALQETGGAVYLAGTLLSALGETAPSTVLSLFFLLIALLSNILSTKACAVLFTPIAVSIAEGLGIDPFPFAVAVVFASNCSFASPIGYQTNLLVMGPGHYRFIDFARAGLPLIIIVWLTFSLFAPWYFGLN